jgi:hypothetical protein
MLGVKLADLDRDAVALPLAAYIDLAPAIIAHAVRVPFVRKFIEAELQAFFAQEGDRRLDDLLKELGALEPVRNFLTARVDEQIRGWAQSPGFVSWFATLLDPTPSA